MVTSHPCCCVIFTRYGLPDFALTREFDISLTLKMSSIRYVHTNRFQSELVAFCQHFLQLQDVLGRMRAASAGQKVPPHPPPLPFFPV